MFLKLIFFTQERLLILMIFVKYMLINKKYCVDKITKKTDWKWKIFVFHIGQVPKAGLQWEELANNSLFQNIQCFYCVFFIVVNYFLHTSILSSLWGAQWYESANRNIVKCLHNASRNQATLGISWNLQTLWMLDK